MLGNTDQETQVVFFNVWGGSGPVSLKLEWPTQCRATQQAASLVEVPNKGVRGVFRSLQGLTFHLG